MIGPDLTVSAPTRVFHSLLLIGCLLFLTSAHASSSSSSSHRHDYCIIGGGPGGLQLGYFMEQKGRDYVIFEKSNVSGNFFTVYPRHRKLISINKRYTGQTNKEFNMRHDWNSLLSHDESLLLKHYSKEMFPHADVLLHYLRDYERKLGINVQHNTEIMAIHTVKDAAMPDGQYFSLDDQNKNNYQCRSVIVATGLWKPNIPKVPGIEYAVGYEDVSINTDDFEGQTVLILGRGNAAFETGDAIYGSTNLIHMVGRSRVRLSWATHYVGDLRAVNNGLLDTYQLKSLDGVLEASLSEVKFVKTKDDKYVVALNTEEEQEVELSYLDNFAMREPYDKIIRCLGFDFDDSIFTNSSRVSRGKGRSKKYPLIKHNYESVEVPGMFFAGTNTHSLDHRKSAGGFIHGFRYTARALHTLLEWRYEGVQWPSKKLPITDLMSYLLKRMNEASGIYQMFSVLGDVILLNEDGSMFEYFEEFPINLLHQFPSVTGHPATRVIALVMQYGANFSGPGNDIFRVDRATGEPSEAHHSNFLHPVLYYYDQLPTEEQMKYRLKRDILPRPKLIHHIVEDFLTLWDAPLSHVLPLRRYLDQILDTDTRHFFTETCFKMAMTHASVPLTCQKHYLEGQGLTGTSALRRKAFEIGLMA
ncbi:FAD-dependent oxidoreductase domain-containing protein 2-like [Haliotis cracherodii]|uniref:FAD-dependent oxidoreductase domain-containing protein 2-like n=1 Tax=Haliotis cracherodii TaxID=6455 RepID=UPI0039E7B1BC